MISVDTLKAYEILLAARLPEEQAKAILEVVKTAQTSEVDHLVTKSEFKEGMAGLKTEMAGLRTEIYQIKFDLLKWLIPLIIGQGAMVVGLLKVLA